MKKIILNRLREYATLPYLVLKALASNLSGIRSYNSETCYYGDDKQQNIIIIKPSRVQKKQGIIFFCHGGGWKSGRSHAFRFVGKFFAGLGYTTIVAGYRKVPKCTYPELVEDTANALKSGVETLKEQGVYDDPIVLIGQSAGAHLVTLLAYSDTLDQVGFKRDCIKGVISVSGPLDFSECRNRYINRLIKGFVINDENKKKADPYLYLRESLSTPILCIHGDCDPTVEAESAVSFVNRMNELNQGLGEVLLIKNGLHSNLTTIFWKETSEQKKMVQWIESLIAL